MQRQDRALPAMKVLGCLPGASVVPANKDPHITVEAPKASAFAMLPEFWMPPSAIVGTPHALATRDT